MELCYRLLLSLHSIKAVSVYPSLLNSCLHNTLIRNLVKPLIYTLYTVLYNSNLEIPRFWSKALEIQVESHHIQSFLDLNREISLEKFPSDYSERQFVMGSWSHKKPKNFGFLSSEFQIMKRKISKSPI